MNPTSRWPYGLPTVGLDASPTREAVLLATPLVVGLAVVAPALGLLGGRVGLPDPIALLVGVGVVGGFYGLVVLLVDRVALGAAVATVVTATFAADVPLTAGVDAYPGSLGPKLLLVHLPLLVLAALLAIRGELSVGSLSRVEYAFGAFVLWSAIVALLGPVPRRDVALYYSLFFLVAFLAYATVSRAVRTDVVTFRGLLCVFLAAVGGHVAIATVQLASQDLLGLSVLGETVRRTSHTVVSLGPLGSFNIGVFVSGFAGGNGALALQIVLALPIALAFAARYAGWRRTALLLFAVVAAAVLRFTAKDSSRGAAMIAMALVGAYLLWRRWEGAEGIAGLSSTAGRWAPLVAAAVVSLFVPSTIQAGEESGGTDGTGGVGGDGSDGAIAGEQISIPFFDLNTLDVRIQQYVVGLDIFASHPLFGVGGANFTYVAARYDVPDIQGISLHNFYLSLLVGTGVPGFLFYSLAVLFVLWSGWRLVRSAVTDHVLVAGVLAALVAYLAAGLLVLPLRYTHVLPFWILAGALVGRSRRFTEDGRRSTPGRRRGSSGS